MKRDSIHICRQELENRILYGLVNEWESGCLVLSPDMRNQMRQPLFRLSGMKRCLGYWSREKREISLSADLVLNHPWDAVRDVLLHEMAHQLSTEVLGGADEPDHGPVFQKACHLLRANPKASGNYKTLHERIHDASVSAEDKILVRIKKLMALSESQNRNEAESAMAKARQLIRKYNINDMAANRDREYQSIFLGSPRLRHFREDYFLANLFIDYYFVDGVWVSAYVLDKARMGRVLEISGTVKNLEIAEYVYEYIENYINAQWNGYNKGSAFTRYHKTDFAIGIITGFRQKLDDQDRSKKDHGKREIIAVNDPNLKQFIKYKYPRLRTTSKQATHRSRQLIDDGMTIGRNLIISKGIREASNGLQGLLKDS